MSRAFVARAFVVAVLASLLLMLSDSRGDAPPQKSKSTRAPGAAKSAGKSDLHSKSKREKPALSEPASGEAKIEAELDKPIDMEYADTPLKDIVDSLASRLGIAIVMDTKALADASITPDTTFTKTIRGIPVRSELRLLLADHDLGYYVDGEVLLVTTNDSAKAHTVIRVYDVSAFAETAESLAWQRGDSAPVVGGAFQIVAQQQPLPQATKQAASKAGTPAATNPATAQASANGCMKASRSVRPAESLVPGEFDYDSLIEAITITTEPSSWDSNGGIGSISPFGGKLVISQTEEVQRQIADLLEAIEPRPAPVPLSMSGPPAVSPWEAKIEKVLDEPIDMEYQDTPLKDIVDSLASKLGITILLDNRALADASVTPDTTFTKTVRGISLRGALHLLLADRDLSYVVKDDVLMITTGDIAKATTYVVIYPVDELISDGYDALIETITSTVAPLSWDSNGGVGSLTPLPRSKILLINQTETVHLQIKDLLMKLLPSKPSATKSSAANPAPVPANSAASGGFELHAYDARSWAGNDNGAKAAPQFVELVRKLIEPKSWNQSEAFIGVSGELVVIRQTPAIHRQIRKLIEVLASPTFPLQPATTTGSLGGIGGGTGGTGGGFGGTLSH